jgi:hypothetical protein
MNTTTQAPHQADGTGRPRLPIPIPDPVTVAFAVPSITSGTPLPAGTPVSLNLVSPQVLGSVTTAVPLGTVVNWALLDDTTGAALAEGADYQVLDGALDAQAFQVVFKPLATGRTVRIVPTVTLLAAGLDAQTSPLAPLTYPLRPLSSPQTLVTDLITRTLCLTAANSLINPGEPAVLQVLPHASAQVPQLATSILHDVPSITIRGAIPLEPLVEALLGPAAGLGKLVTGGKVNLEGALSEVHQLLSEPLSIPIALNINGQRLATTLAPIGKPALPTFTSVPAESGTYRGFLPVGQWQSPFEIAQVDWQLTEATGAAAVSADLSPGQDFVKSFVLQPQVTDMSSTLSALVNPVTVTVTLTVTLDETVFGKGPVSLVLPPLVLQRMPLPVPPMAALFTNALNSLGNPDPQRVCIAVPARMIPLLSSYDDFVKVVTRLGSVVNNLLAAVGAVGGSWDLVTQLAKALSAVLNEAGRADEVLFVPIWQDTGQITLTDEYNDAISAVIAVAPNDWYFRLSDAEDSASQIDFGVQTAGTPTCVSIVPNLDDAFRNVIQDPADTAVATYPDLNLNDALEVIQFLQTSN